MSWLRKKAVVLMISFLSLGIWTPAVHSAALPNNDLIKVTVNITIENPDYFWKYPFFGKQIDAIRVSGMGQNFSVQADSRGEKIEFDVPKDYKLKIALAFQNNNETVKEFRYSTKRGAENSRNSLNILLKAPAPQSVTFTTGDFEEVRG